jgi:hypothetical protein
MIKTVKVTNYLGESITLDLANPETSGFYIKSIEGLGPPKASINMTELSTSDGALYNSSRVAPRNIVLSLGFMFSPTIEDARYRSYKYFPVKKQIKLLVTTDSRVGEINGYVESNEPDIFSPEETTQISIICPDPFFRSEKVNTTLFSGVVSRFEFPFSNESLTDNLIEIGVLHMTTERTIYYEGDSEVGVVITVYAFGPVSQLKIFDPENWQKQMVIDSGRIESITGSDIVEGDNIIISTVRGDKYIVLVRNGETYNILNALNRDAYWFRLFKEDNLFSYTAEFGLTNLNFTIENRTVYEGM